MSRRVGSASAWNSRSICSGSSRSATPERTTIELYVTHPRRSWQARDPERAASSVVVAGLQDDDVVALDEVHQAVFAVDAAGPGTRQGVAQLLRFADPV